MTSCSDVMLVATFVEDLSLKLDVFESRECRRFCKDGLFGQCGAAVDTWPSHAGISPPPLPPPP